MDRNWKVCAGLPSRYASLIGGRETILESLARLARGAGRPDRMADCEWMWSGTVSPGRPVSRSDEAFLLVMCIRRAGVPDGFGLMAKSVCRRRGSRPRPPLLFHSAAMCYKLSVSLADRSCFIAVVRRINPDLRGSHDRQTVSSGGLHRGNELG